MQAFHNFVSIARVAFTIFWKQTAVSMCTYLVQVEVGSKLPDVQLILPSAKDPTPDSFVTTQELFQGMSSAHRILV